MHQQNNNDTLRSVKDWFTFAVAVIATVSGVIFWIQRADNDQFERIETKIEAVEADIDKIREDNVEIIRLIGKLEGKLER
jgi:cell division protein FtsB